MIRSRPESGAATTRASWRGRLTFIALTALLLAASPLAELQISGKVLFRSPSKVPSRGAEADLAGIFAQNPAYMRIEALGLSKTSGHGQELFAEADRAAKKALAFVAEERDLHVITALGGIQGGEISIEDLTEVVVSHLPVYCIDGVAHHGSKKATDQLAEMDRDRVWSSISAYREWCTRKETDVDYYFLKEEYERVYFRALKQVVRDHNLSAVIELGGVTSRLEPAPDITDEVIGSIKE